MEPFNMELFLTGNPPSNFVHEASVDTIEERPSKRACLNPVDKLASNHYPNILRQMDNKQKSLRSHINQGNLSLVEQELTELRDEIAQVGEELSNLRSGSYLRAVDFKHLLLHEEVLYTTIVPQLGLHELDYVQMKSGELGGEVPLCLSLIHQGNAGPIYKDKPLGPFVLRLLTGATVSPHIQSEPVQPEIVDTSQRLKKNNTELENQKAVFKENGLATFEDLKFSSGTFPHPIRLKFRASFTICLGNRKVSKTVESASTRPYISMTNTGSQWKDAAGTWLKEDCFGDAYEVSLPCLWNYFQKHFLQALKQDVVNPRRGLQYRDFQYMIKARGLNKPTINQKEFQKFWEWIGPAIKKIRYQKHLLWMYEQGFLACFVTRQEAVEQLKNEILGTFILRLSERLDGEFVISYTLPTGVRHYLIQPDDTADKKKTLVDFLGQNHMFIYILQVTNLPEGGFGWQRHKKDKILEKYYKKAPNKPIKSAVPSNPYDTFLPGPN
eukprot:TRINITY_DN13424_c0_g1_i1.p1 TRINITY_DN13424_c0_g1~~TRINITY_DN13424_c0_g1_i1.p1  ORF type:complete len:543 (+),score=125.57 TRINITY_DN13424_c0_g1_i1:140-1630(+)